MELKCSISGNDGHGARRQCIMPMGHEQDADPRNHKHLFRGKVGDIVLRYEDEGAKPYCFESAISDDLVENIAEDLNDTDSQYRYSNEQVKAVIWQFMENHIDDFVEQLDEHWWKYFRNLGEREKERLLGEPERDLAQEQREAHGDYLFDVARGN